MPEHNSASDPQVQILVALSAVPLNRVRLLYAMQLAAQRGKGESLRRRSRDLASSFQDALTQLLAKGFVDRTPHPLRRYQVFHITDNGWEALNRKVSLPSNERRRIMRSALKAVEDEAEPSVA